MDLPGASGHVSGPPQVPGCVALTTLEAVAQLGARQGRALTRSFSPPSFLKLYNYFTILSRFLPYISVNWH